MIGMGPFIPHNDTPMNKQQNEVDLKQNLKLTLKMIAALRIYLKDINIAAATALQAIDPMGREFGLSYGANVIMPLATPSEVRKEYQLYDGKPCLDDLSDQCSQCVIMRIESIGRKVGYNDYGDSKHFRK